MSDFGHGLGRTELMTVEEVATYLRIPKSTLYGWRYRGIGPPAIRVGRYLRYPEGELERWLETGADGEWPGGSAA